MNKLYFIWHTEAVVHSLNGCLPPTLQASIDILQQLQALGHVRQVVSVQWVVMRGKVSLYILH